MNAVPAGVTPAVAEYADAVGAALPWALSAPRFEAQRRADRTLYRLKVADARARLQRRLGQSS